MFQSTPLREGRPDGGLDLYDSLRFNPRPYEWGDLRDWIANWPIPEFQSTPLREGRPSIRRMQLYLRSGFNPRPYERGDIAKRLIISNIIRFNPRPYERGDY